MKSTVKFEYKKFRATFDGVAANLLTLGILVAFFGIVIAMMLTELWAMLI